MITDKQIELKNILIHAESININLKIDDAIVIYCESKYAIASLANNVYIDWIDIWLEHIARLISSVSPSIGAILNNPGGEHTLIDEDIDSLELEIKLVLPAYTAYLLMGLLSVRLVDPTCEVVDNLKYYIEHLGAIVAQLCPSAAELLKDADFSQFQSQ